MHHPIKTNLGYELAVTPPEEAAGAAYRAMEWLMESLGIAIRELPMDMATRVLTNGKAVDDASRWVKENPTVTYVKGPGITPTDEQVLATIATLQKAGRLPSTLSASAIKDQLAPIGSPNAKWRDELCATLHRGVTPELQEHSTASSPDWSKNKPLTVYAYKATGDNTQTMHYIAGGKIFLSFVPQGSGNPEPVGPSGDAAHSVSPHTSLHLFTASENAFKMWARDVLQKIADANAELAYGLKQTVLKTYDGVQLKWLQEVLHEKGTPYAIAEFARARDAKLPNELNTGLLVDNLFAILSTEQLKQPTAIICPNHSYSDYVHDVWKKVSEAGGFKLPENSEIVRASATGDHYKAIQYTAKKAGMLEVKGEQGEVLAEKAMGKGDVAMLTHLDRGRVRDMIIQTLNTAIANGRTKILFGFDDDGEYYSSAIGALRDVMFNKKYASLEIKIMNAAEATAHFFTSGVKNTTLILNNIHGDFATDIELCGKGTSYSTATIMDGRGAVELGSGGTAPALLDLWRKKGVLEFNPISFLEGISLALKFTAQNMKKGGVDNARIKRVHALADAIELGIFASTDKGIMLPIASGKFRMKAGESTLVGTQTFLQSVLVEALRMLKDSYPEFAEQLPEAEKRLVRMVAIDKAIFAAAQKYGERWREVNMVWHAACEESGIYDPFTPNYTIPVLDEMPTAEITADALMSLQESRVKAIVSKKTGT